MIKFKFCFAKEFEKNTSKESLQDIDNIKYVFGCASEGFAYVNLGAWGWNFYLTQFNEDKLIDKMVKNIVHEYVHAAITDKDRLRDKRFGYMTDKEEKFVRIMAGHENMRKKRKVIHH
jgi:hypothetical protein